MPAALVLEIRMSSAAIVRSTCSCSGPSSARGGYGAPLRQSHASHTVTCESGRPAADPSSRDVPLVSASAGGPTDRSCRVQGVECRRPTADRKPLSPGHPRHGLALLAPWPGAAGRAVRTLSTKTDPDLSLFPRPSSMGPDASYAAGTPARALDPPPACARRGKRKDLTPSVRDPSA